VLCDFERPITGVDARQGRWWEGSSRSAKTRFLCCIRLHWLSGGRGSAGRRCMRKIFLVWDLTGLRGQKCARVCTGDWGSKFVERSQCGGTGAGNGDSGFNILLPSIVQNCAGF